MEDLIQKAKNKLATMSTPEPNTGCLLWLGLTNKNGYGKIGFNYKSWTTHRLAFHLFKQSLSHGDLVCHKCDTPACINPEHLFLGTPLLNMQDKVNKGRHRNQNMDKTHCKHGHEFTADNIRYDRTAINEPKRVCIACYTAGYKRRNAMKSSANYAR